MSLIFFCSNVVELIVASISHYLGVRVSTEPERYLGLPSMVRRNRRRAFQGLKDRMRSQIESWVSLADFGGSVIVVGVVFIGVLGLSYDIVCKVICYLRELNAVQERLPGCLIRVEHWQPLEGTILKVNFDASFTLACSHVVRLAVDLSLQEVTFEGDSLIVICKACSPLYDVSAIRTYVKDVKVMVLPFTAVCFLIFLMRVIL
ncbi:hypothetical protein Golob_027372 [Gossypium lobatum]|uniref:RNase H type-1 domain-containing protein n=1 Tax=Gossypium lobatum TaxID=34289 RepID=A0A7J8NHA2_9ROSI|nr:hypothetical protein [Gossypium lobatum]